MKNIAISVVMPTFNSEHTIEKALQSIRNQTFPQEQLEILIVDGGSTDKTISIAKKYECIILNNPKTQPEFAKYIGIQNAKGTYCIFLDSDEVLTHVNSFKVKFDLFQKNNEIKNCLIGGLINPPKYPFINEYASHIGDPFSYFMYGIDAGNYRQSLENKFKSKVRIAHFTIYKRTNETLPICDGGGHFFDLLYLKENFDINDEKMVSTIFDAMVSKTKQFAVLDDDFVLHYSNTSIKKYISKIKWRVIGNIHYAHEVVTGFSEREKAQSYFFKFKKLLFIPLTILLVWPLYSSVILIMNKRDFLYALHVLFSLYTALLILFYYVLKILKIKPAVTHYGS